MILADYFRAEHDATWDIAAACGVSHGIIRLPEDGKFDYADASHWDTLVKRFTDFGVTPVAIEPMPNELHDHIKLGDERRDESIAAVISMLPHMRRHGINTICFNWMAHIGWLRTRVDCPERGGARVTAFSLKDLGPPLAAITEETLWKNYEYFIRAVIPHAERYGIRLALHPDDPPLERIGDVARIMVNRRSIRRAITEFVSSECLGITMCQACFHLMGEDIEDTIAEFSDRIFMIHFRNVRGQADCFRETFHDNGAIPMADVMRAYHRHGIHVPIRVDHVPTLKGELSTIPGYDAMGRLFAIGYLKGILDALK